MSKELNLDKIKKIRAFYDHACVWNEWANPKQFARAEPDSLGYILGIPLKTEDGLHFVKNELQGNDEAVAAIIAMCDRIEELEVENIKQKVCINHLSAGVAALWDSVSSGIHDARSPVGDTTLDMQESLMGIGIDARGAKALELKG